MKTQSIAVIGAVALSFASAVPTFAITNTAIAVSGTNIVLSWPSYGYEIYLVRSRQTLSSADAWSCVTNAYSANGTNQTTFTIYGVVPPPPGGSGDSFAAMTTEGDADNLTMTSEPMVMRDDGSGSAVPLKLYPPGFDLSDFTIFDPVTGQSVSGSGYTVSSWSSDDPQPLDGGSGDPLAVATQFFEVFQIPDFPAGITNYIFDGPTFIPVAMDDYGERTENFEVLLDGQPTDYAQYMSLFYNGQTNWGMGIYFDRIPNGTHQIQLVSTLHLNDEVDDEAIFLVLSNRAQSITVDNQITFTNWDDTIWNNTNYTFRAQSKNPDTDWWIDIFDAWGNWVNGAAGHTTNGQIEWTWDLTDYDGNLRDSLENDPFFDPWITFNLATANGSAGANSQASRPTPVTLVPYPVQGEWMISCQNEFYTSGSAGHDYMFEAMGAIQGWVDYRDVPTLFYPVVYGTNGTTQADRDDSWETLKLILARGGDFRNFYYFGHGNSNSIGGDLNDYDTNGVVVGCRDLPGSKAHLYSRTAHDEITHNLSTGVHQFRFVWLDGCNTALGNWPDFAFDVNKATNTLSYYTSTNTNPRHLRPSAFVGWATKPGGGNQWGHVDDYFFYRSEWIREWSYNALTKSLHDALNDAVADSNWPPGREIQLWNGLRTYGYIALKMNEYNQKNDWPHP